MVDVFALEAEFWGFDSLLGYCSFHTFATKIEIHIEFEDIEIFFLFICHKKIC